jgi:hypothetical protein
MNRQRLHLKGFALFWVKHRRVLNLLFWIIYVVACSAVAAQLLARYFLKGGDA